MSLIMENDIIYILIAEIGLMFIFAYILLERVVDSTSDYLSGKYKYKYSDMMKEFQNFSLLIICKSVLSRLLNSETDANGSKLALREITNANEPIYQGIVIEVIGNMSDELKRRFYTFYKKSKDDSTLILQVSSLIESYSIKLMDRMKVLELKAQQTNRLAAQREGDKLINVSEFVNANLIKSISEDIDVLSSSNVRDIVEEN